MDNVRSATSWLGFFVVVVLIVVASPLQVVAQEHELWVLGVAIGRGF